MRILWDGEWFAETSQLSSEFRPLSPFLRGFADLVAFSFSTFLIMIAEHLFSFPLLDWFTDPFNLLARTQPTGRRH